MATKTHATHETHESHDTHNHTNGNGTAVLTTDFTHADGAPVEQHPDGASIAAAALNQAATTSTTTTPALTGPDGKKLSPKNKLVRGIDPSLKTTWIDLNLSEERNAILAKAAKHRGCKVDEVIAPLLAKAVEDNWAQIEEDAAKYTPASSTGDKRSATQKISEMSPEEAQAYIEKQKKLAESAIARATAAAARAQAMLAAAQAAAQAATE